MGANSFLLVSTLFQNRAGEQESKQEVIKVVSLVKHGKLSIIISSLKKRFDHSHATELKFKLPQNFDARHLRTFKDFEHKIFQALLKRKKKVTWQMAFYLHFIAYFCHIERNIKRKIL